MVNLLTGLGNIITEFDTVNKKMNQFRDNIKSIEVTMEYMGTAKLKKDKQGMLFTRIQQFSKETGEPIYTKDGKPVYSYYRHIKNTKYPTGKDSPFADLLFAYKKNKKAGGSFSDLINIYTKRRELREKIPKRIARPISGKEFNAPGLTEVSPFENLMEEGGVMAKMVITPFKAIQTGLKPLKPIFNFMGKKVEGFGKTVLKSFGMPDSKIKNTMKAFKGFGKVALLSGGLMFLVSILMQLISAMNPFQIIMETLTNIFGIYGAILETAFIPLITKLYEVMLSETTLNLIQDIAKAVAQMVIAFLPIIDIIAPLVTVLLGGLVVVLNVLATAISFLLTPLNGIGALFNGLNEIFIIVLSYYQQYLQPIFEGIFTFFRVLYDTGYAVIVTIVEFIGGAFTTAFEGIKSAFIWISNQINTIGNIFQTAIATIVDGIYNFIKSIDFFNLLPDNQSSGGSGSSINEIPYDESDYYQQKQAELLEDIAYNTSYNSSRGF